MIVVLVDRRIVMIATNMNVTNAMNRSARSALRNNFAINVEIAIEWSVQSAVILGLGRVVVIYVMTYAATNVDCDDFYKESRIAQNAT
mmetsp:Transcript_12327/g.19011  ORF Transcript_12327/g.19011 Transcript_12327/m.19011 type:complete len:88 (-) Transcript_12327:225-488(-)